MQYQLSIKSYEDRDYIHVIAVRPTREALSRIEDGANINLNHDDYYTDIEEIEEEA